MPNKEAYEVLARCVINSLVRYDREYHAYLAYYLNDEGGVKVMAGILEDLLKSFEQYEGTHDKRFVSNA